MHGPIMRPDFHEGIPFQQISGSLCFSKSWICYWPFPVGPPTKVPLPSVTHADRRRQSSVEKQRKETRVWFFHQRMERWELLLQIGALPGLCFRALASGNGGGALTGLSRRSCAGLGWAPCHRAGSPPQSPGTKGLRAAPRRAAQWAEAMGAAVWL